MAIRGLKVNDEWYVSLEDIIKVMKESKDIESALKSLSPKNEMEVDLNALDSTAFKEMKEDKEELSDFNKKLKKGLDWNPRKLD